MADNTSKEAAKRRDAHLDEQRKQSEADTQAQLERTSSTQPTPTQAENDRAKLGFQSLAELDEKEPDGSAEEKGSGAAYLTRESSAK